MEVVFLAEAEVLGGGERPGDDGDEARSGDEALHDGRGGVLGRAVAQEEPDGCDIGEPCAPVACCGGEGRGGPEEAEEHEAEECGDGTEGGGAEAGGRDCRRAADGGESCRDEEREAERDGEDRCAFGRVLKPEDGEADAEGEDEADESGEEQEAAAFCCRCGSRRLPECGRHVGEVRWAGGILTCEFPAASPSLL